MRRLLREPLVHFLGLGALLFLLYGWLQGGVLHSTDEIVVSRGQLLFVGFLLGAWTVLARLPMNVPGWAYSVPPYAIGTVAMFWVIERIGAF